MCWSYQLFPVKAKISHINHVTSASTMITPTNNKNIERHTNTSRSNTCLLAHVDNTLWIWAFICAKCIVCRKALLSYVQRESSVNEIFYAFVPNNKTHYYLPIFQRHSIIQYRMSERACVCVCVRACCTGTGPKEALAAEKIWSSLMASTSKSEHFHHRQCHIYGWKRKANVLFHSTVCVSSTWNIKYIGAVVPQGAAVHHHSKLFHWNNVICIAWAPCIKCHWHASPLHSRLFFGLPHVCVHFSGHVQCAHFDSSPPI